MGLYKWECVMSIHVCGYAPRYKAKKHGYRLPPPKAVYMFPPKGKSTLKQIQIKFQGTMVWLPVRHLNNNIPQTFSTAFSQRPILQVGGKKYTFPDAIAIGVIVGIRTRDHWITSSMHKRLNYVAQHKDVELTLQ
ncbi:hypothetical protein ElyMa_003150700 [Elysia marginata]|uniref:Uncharacterized protein n=1 Tax=Elysia marginata TaxID=1093978 RepID=A0AAV4IVG7_9GAST|nr:hypothetical protein ElyMa_003150700 [Elysia marginata]